MRNRRGRRIRRVIGGLFLAVLIVCVPTAAFVGLKCYSPGQRVATAPAVEIPADLAGYARSEAFTFLTLPEWFIVYSAEEYARFIGSASPSDFPYLGSIADYWGYYGAVCDATRSAYPFEGGYHMMLGVIGASFTIENVLKSVYENIIGRLTARLATRDTPEDAFAATVAAEYAAFMHTIPWYQFEFWSRLRRLWTEIPLTGPHMARKWERRLALSAEYGVKGAYGWLIGRGSQNAYGPEDLKIYARAAGPMDAVFGSPEVEKVRQTRDVYIVRLPRYEAFTKISLALLDSGVRFVEVAGNDEMLVTALGPTALDESRVESGVVVWSRPIRTDPSRKRVALRVPVARLHQAIPQLRTAGATIEHLYDY